MEAKHAMGLLVAVALAPRALADEQPKAAAAAPQAEVRAQDVAALRKQVEELKGRLDALAESPAKAGSGAGNAKGTVQFYGHLDLSAEAADKGIGGRVTTAILAPGGPSIVGTTSVGTLGWLAAIASNSSYFGVRGGLDLGDEWKAVFQVETQVEAAATPGVSATNFHDDAVVKGAIAFRNTFVGFAGPYGALKAGKSFAPYYNSTSRLDPFYATVGTYTAIMGNTGGDNRVEFATRMSHAIWYESPKFGAVSFSVLGSPGQNRNDDNLIQSQAEPGCTGGYSATALQGYLCNDGAWSDVLSASVAYDQGPLYAAAAWEWHRHVNRTVDEVSYGGASPDGSIGIANEWAWKVAAQYSFPSGTRLGGAFEQMKRSNPYLNQDYNERDRIGWWLTVSQKLTDHDELSVGWGHAGKTPGDVGTNRSDGTFNAGPVANQANLISAGVWHRFLDGNPAVYLVYAAEVNQNGAHYDLGAGSHGIQYDCHDGNPVGVPPIGYPPYVGNGGRCWTGATLQAVSLGMTYNF